MGQGTHARHAVMLRPRGRRLRTWLSLVGTGLLAAGLATGPAGSPAAAQAGDAPGQGSAYAQTTKVDPRVGSLSLGITFGQALAGHQNSVAQAQSQAGNLGQIGGTLAAEGCDGGDPTLPKESQPQPIRIDSREEGAAEGRSEPDLNGGATRFVRATPAPFAEAITETAPMTVAEQIKVGGGRATSTSGLVEGARVATAVSDVSGIDVAGVVQLTGLRWEAIYQSGATPSVRGTFSIASASIAGQPVPTDDPTATIAQANAVLEPLGFRFEAPTVHEDAGILFIDPMTIRVVPSPTRDAVTGGVLGTVQPGREALIDLLLEADCSASGATTILDVVLGSITGAGSLGLELGGVQATSGEIKQNPFALGRVNLTSRLGTPAPGATALGTAGGGAGSAPSLDGSSPAGGSPAATAGSPPAPTTAALASGRLEGERGGALAGVGLGGLLLAAALAEADRRKMRRAQRELAELL